MIKSIYDKIHQYKIDIRLLLPSNLWHLLEIEECTIVQKKWLLFYTSNHGSWVDACDKTNTKISIYKKWMYKNTKSISNTKFQIAKSQIDEAFVDIAEQKLKENAASKNQPAIKMFLENNHNTYKKIREERPGEKPDSETMPPMKAAYDSLPEKKRNQALQDLLNGDIS